MRRLLLWLVMVVGMVALILAGAAAYLYSRTGEDSLPQEPVTFGEQALEPNGWDWTVPVLGDILSKTYHSPTNLTIQQLGTFSDGVPQLVLPAWATRAEITLTAPDGTIWAADAETCNTYTYAQNGEYEIAVTAYSQPADSPGSPQGWYAYRANYTMQLAPSVTLSAERAAQGSIVAIRLAGILDGEPSLETDLGPVWFRKTANGYIGYIPVTYNAESGDHAMTLTCGTLTQELTLTVSKTEYGNIAVEAEEESGGAEEFRNAIWPLYTTGEAEKRWSGPFQAPSTAAVTCDYGLVQMVDGQRSGQATGLTYGAAPGESVTAPQSGTVAYAGTLALTGGTVVIDHGCGVKSYLFGLQDVTVAQGQAVTVGDAVGTAGEAHDLIYELRIGNKSVDPEAAIQGRSGLQYHESE